MEGRPGTGTGKSTTKMSRTSKKIENHYGNIFNKEWNKCYDSVSLKYNFKVKISWKKTIIKYNMYFQIYLKY